MGGWIAHVAFNGAERVVRPLAVMEDPGVEGERVTPAGSPDTIARRGRTVHAKRTAAIRETIAMMARPGDPSNILETAAATAEEG